MRSKLLYFSIIFLLSCSADKKSDTHDSLISGDSSLKTSQLPLDSAEATDSDCVFNDDYKTLTIEWLNELKIEDFIWREDLRSAMIPQGQDTVFLSQGGCNHFGISVEILIRNRSNELTDSIFWISKALELADKYKMNDYSEVIRKGKLKRSNIDENSVWYEVFPEDDGAVYDGINVVIERDHKRLSISKYFN